ncbi:MAG: methyltransferase domain-containing protein [Cyclobacteriaceae bacterium]
MKDLHGKAILDFYRGNEAATLTLHNSYGEPEEMPVEVFFREEEDFSTLEHLALIECQGKVLDLGAGAGAHALVLQSQGKDVTALENSAGCAEVMRQSGVGKVVQQDFYKHTKKYDTVLVLMNGLGLAGTLRNLPVFLVKLISLLTPDGQILIDSSDISYLYEDGLEKPTGYYGEVRYRYEYLKENGDWFDWVYVDQETLKTEVSKLDLNMEVLHTDENDQYLARITS